MSFGFIMLNQRFKTYWHKKREVFLTSLFNIVGIKNL